MILLIERYNIYYVSIYVAQHKLAIVLERKGTK